MRQKPLNDLEMFDILQAAYPEKFPNEDDETWEKAMNFADEFSGFEELADLLGRVVMMTIPMESALSGKFHHCLGHVKINDGKAQMMAVVKRKIEP